MNVLFFKVENVLNFPESDARAPDGRLGIVDKRIKLLKEELLEMGQGAQLVLIGDWAKDWAFEDKDCTDTGRYLKKKLARKGLHIMDKSEGYDPVTNYVQRKHVETYKILESL